MIRKLLSNQLFHFSNEAELQDGIEAVLKGEGVEYIREYRLDSGNIIDFYIPGEKIGIEVKVDGSGMQVIRQLMRYAEKDDIDNLILVTSRSKHISTPGKMKEKPVSVIFLGSSML